MASSYKNGLNGFEDAKAASAMEKGAPPANSIFTTIKCQQDFESE